MAVYSTADKDCLHVQVGAGFRLGWGPGREVCGELDRIRSACIWAGALPASFLCKKGCRTCRAGPRQSPETGACSDKLAGSLWEAVVVTAARRAVRTGAAGAGLSQEALQVGACLLRALPAPPGGARLPTRSWLTRRCASARRPAARATSTSPPSSPPPSRAARTPSTRCVPGAGCACERFDWRALKGCGAEVWWGGWLHGHSFGSASGGLRNDRAQDIRARELLGVAGAGVGAQPAPCWPADLPKAEERHVQWRQRALMAPLHECLDATLHLLCPLCTLSPLRRATASCPRTPPSSTSATTTASSSLGPSRSRRAGGRAGRAGRPGLGAGQRPGRAARAHSMQAMPHSAHSREVVGVARRRQGRDLANRGSGAALAPAFQRLWWA